MEGNLEFVNKCFEFCNKTAEVLKDSFGPNGFDILLSTTSGTLMLTNDGFHAVRSLSNCDPVGKFLFQGLDLFYKSTGDFSKKFVLLMRELLAEVLSVVSVGQSSPSQQILCISQGIDELLSRVIPAVFDQFLAQKIISETVGRIDDAISILKTTINGKFSPKVCEVLVSLLRQLFLNELSDDVASLKERTDKVLENFSDIVWEVPGKPLMSSLVLEGVLIPREFSTMVKKLPRSPENLSFNFIILGSSFGYNLPQTDTVLSLSNSQQVDSMLQWRRKHIESVLKVLVEHKVELIITPITLHETFIHVCNQYHIAAIHSIPKEDTTRISNIFRIHPLHELKDDLSSFIGGGTSCKLIQVGHHLYVHLESTKMVLKQILLYAPTKALCHQYSIALGNMLKVLRTSFKHKQHKSLYSISFVPGGSTFELALAHALEEYGKVDLNPNTQAACKILEKALLGISWRLAWNSGCKLSIFELKAKTNEALKADNFVPGLNQAGMLCSTKKAGILEPAMANVMLIFSVLQLFLQVLKTSGIVRVKTLSNKNAKAKSEDSDSDLESG